MFRFMDYEFRLKVLAFRFLRFRVLGMAFDIWSLRFRLGFNVFRFRVLALWFKV